MLARKEIHMFDDELWDVFLLDDVDEDPEPEYGDFWGETDEEADP
jgi:hypothetical protein